MSSLKDVYAHNKNVVYRSSSQEVVLVLDLRENEMYEITDLAAEVFTHMDGVKSLNTIFNSLMAKYSPPQAVFKKDVLSLVKNLLKKDLIHKIN